MKRSFTFVSLLLVASLPVACSFNKATEDEIRMDAGAVRVDVRLPDNADGNNTFESDATVTCVATNPMTTNVPPDILILLDRSGSMNQQLDGTTCAGGCGANSKWTITTTALANYLPTIETTVNLGLKLFASPSGSSCTVSPTAEIAPRANNAAMINTLLAGRTSQPGSSTPTTAAMMNAASYLKTVTDNNPKFILLVTDGIPTCGKDMCAAGVDLGGGSMTQCDDANAIAMVKTVHDMGISTFVLGVGTSTSPGDGTLSQMAMNGGYARNATPAYYPIDKPDDLTAAFQAVTGMVSKCFFGVSPPLTGGQSVTGVTADGNDLAPGDYMIIGNNGVQLVGQKCDEFTSGTIKNIQLQVSCNG